MTQPASPAPGVPRGARTLVRLDGTVADRTEPLLRADDLGALRGDGVFEAALVVDGHPRHLDAHLDRLARSAAALDLPAPDHGVWRRAVETALAHHRAAGEAYVRLLLTRGVEGEEAGTGYVLVDDVPAATHRAREEGVDVVTLTRGTLPTDAAPWLLQGAKTLSYAVNMAAQRWARAQGAQDAVFLTAEGTVLEAPTAAVLLLKDGVLLSPSPELGILPSITLSALFGTARTAGWATRFTTDLTRDDLLTGDGLWLVSSVRLCARIRSIDGTLLPAGPHDGEITALVRQAETCAPT